ncbi:MAG TPA: threonine/serine dehydratase [Ktedonobacterales bacterium]
MVSYQDVLRAREVVGGQVRKTPMFSATTLGAMAATPVSLFLKAEMFQKTGSFKPRGVLYRLSTLTDEEKRRGLIAASAGNHGQSLAWGASSLGIASTIVMPEFASKSKIAAAQGYGATVILHGKTSLEAHRQARALAEEQHLTLVHPYTDERVIAGHGTLGLDIVDDLPDADVVVVQIGGGALCGGSALAIKSRSPKMRVVGVEPAGAARLTAALAAGHPVTLENVQTRIDGLGAGYTGDVNLALFQQYVDAVVTIEDDAVDRAIALLAERCKLVVEPAGAATVAAVLAGKVPVKSGEKVVAVLSGGNIDPVRLAGILTQAKERS